MIKPEKLNILTPLQEFFKDVGDLGKLIVATGFKSCPKSKKSPNLVTLTMPHLILWLEQGGSTRLETLLLLRGLTTSLS